MRSVVDDARRSVAEGAPAWEDWIVDAEINLMSCQPFLLFSRRSSLHLVSLRSLGDREDTNVPLHRDGKLPTPRTGLNNNVILFDTRLEKLGLCACDEGFDDGAVPAGVDDGDAES